MEETMVSDLNETIKDMETPPLGRSKVDILFEALEREWAAAVTKPTADLYLLHDM
jgi:hypothetical protein